ncbi:MAG TPA: anti-sigma factor [Tepidisphaeraceae bacterium]|nr:anti-sigma factor [Tepidisphaeraceae bacterium]
MGVLEGAEREELLAHLATGCPTCIGRLGEAHAILALLPLSLEATPAPKATRGRILERVKASPAPAAKSAGFAATHTGKNRLTRTPWTAPAALGGAIAAGIAILILTSILFNQQKSVDNLKSEIVEKQRQIVQLRAAGQEGEDMKRLVDSPAAQLVTLHGNTTRPNARGHVMWDPVTKSFHFSSGDLPNLAAGRAYELWLINSQQKKIPAAVCRVNSRGAIDVTGSLKTDPGVIVATAVTDEPSAGSEQPTGTIQLIGKFN